MSAASAGSLHVCYQFATEEYFFSAVTVDVYDVTIEAVNGAPDVIVVGQTKTLNVAIEGPNAQLVTGFVTLAEESCAGAVVFPGEKTSQVSILLEHYYPTSLVMCYTLSYNDVNEPAKFYYAVAQKEFYNLRIENSMINFLIAEKETPVHANGVGIEDGDHVFFIDAEGSCSVETELIYPVQNGVAMVTLPAGTESPKRACYRFGIETAVLYEPEILVYSVRSDLNLLSFNNTVAYFHLTVEPAYDAEDQFTFVPVESALPRDADFLQAGGR